MHRSVIGLSVVQTCLRPCPYILWFIFLKATSSQLVFHREGKPLTLGVQTLDQELLWLGSIML